MNEAHCYCSTETATWTATYYIIWKQHQILVKDFLNIAVNAIESGSVWFDWIFMKFILHLYASGKKLACDLVDTSQRSQCGLKHWLKWSTPGWSDRRLKTLKTNIIIFFSSDFGKKYLSTCSKPVKCCSGLIMQKLLKFLCVSRCAASIDLEITVLEKASNITL